MPAISPELKIIISFFAAIAGIVFGIYSYYLQDDWKYLISGKSPKKPRKVWGLYIFSGIIMIIGTAIVNIASTRVPDTELRQFFAIPAISPVLKIIISFFAAIACIVFGILSVTLEADLKYWIRKSGKKPAKKSWRFWTSYVCSGLLAIGNMVIVTTAPSTIRIGQYFFIVDASTRMAGGLSNDTSKWDALQTALQNFFLTLPDNTNKSLIVLGGNLPESTLSCGQKENQITVPLGFDNRAEIVNTIETLQPGGVASLDDALVKTKEVLFNIPEDQNTALYLFLGGGDECAKDEWIAFRYFLESAASRVDYISIVLLPNLENPIIEPSELNKIIDDYDLNNVTIYSPENSVVIATSQSLIYTLQPSQPVLTTTPTFTLAPTNTPSLPTYTPQPTDTQHPTYTSTPEPSWIVKTYKNKRGDSLFWMITTITGVAFIYVIGIGALLVSAWKKGSAVFSRSWLTKLASRPFLISPGFGKWVLFIGYRMRLQSQPDVLRASTKFFGVPGIEPDGKTILPDSNGHGLVECISKSLAFQQPALIEAKGGGGKTTLLARLSYLALNDGLPAQLKGYKPIFITPAYYTDNLIDSIASVLRERDGVAIDKDMAQAQLESGEYLILFDGVSEILGDQNKGLQEILRTARNADYRNCRFIITTRPGLTIPSELNVLRLQPLSTEVVLQFLPLYKLDREQEFQVKKQLSLFGEKPIEPLLFNMIVEQGRNDKLSSTRSQLYERFFRRQLRVTTDTVWEGWRTVLGEFARWFMLETGRRGVGIIHETLIDKISMKPGDQNTSSLFERSKKYYQLPVESELNLLEKLQASAVFQRSKRWQFAHDTYEEYFAACYIVSYLTVNEKLPSLGLWTINDAQIQSFVGVIEFLKELADDELLKILLNSSLPNLWREVLMSQTKDNN